MKVRILKREGLAQITVDARFFANARQAAFLFTDQAYAFIDQNSAGQPVVFLRLKSGEGGTALKSLALDYCEQVRTQRIRRALERVGRSQRRLLLRASLAER